MDSATFPYQDARWGNINKLKSWVADGGRSDEPLLQYVAETWTPLMFACAEGDEVPVRLIIEAARARASARISTRVLPSLSPLHVAARYGHASVASTLIELGADVCPRDSLGLTPLHYAAAHGHLGFIQILLDAGADTSVEAPGGATPLEMAGMAGFEDVRAMLARHTLGGEVGTMRRRALASWLEALGCKEFMGGFLSAGYDDVVFMAKHGLTDADLDCIGVPRGKLGLRKKLLAMHAVDDFIPRVLKQERATTRKVSLSHDSGRNGHDTESNSD